MSLLGQSLQFDPVCVTSGFPPETDILISGWHVSKVPIVLQKSFCGIGLKFSEL
jgi:hypothetical protein